LLTATAAAGWSDHADSAGVVEEQRTGREVLRFVDVQGREMTQHAQRSTQAWRRLRQRVFAEESDCWICGKPSTSPPAGINLLHHARLRRVAAGDAAAGRGGCRTPEGARDRRVADAHPRTLSSATLTRPPTCRAQTWAERGRPVRTALAATFRKTVGNITWNAAGPDVWQTCWRRRTAIAGVRCPASQDASSGVGGISGVDSQ
jgi:hypothetical protein